jgi:hypothetical protein
MPHWLAIKTPCCGPVRGWQRGGTLRTAAEMNRWTRPTAARYEYGRRDGAGREESSGQFVCYLIVDTVAFRYPHFAAVMN